MIEKKFINDDLEIELTSFIDDKQNVWFRGKDIAKILGYKKARIRRKQNITTCMTKMFPRQLGGSTK